MKIKYILIIIILASFTFALICSAETNKEKTASATRKVLKFNAGGGLPIEMIECPAGDFIMGCSDEEYINEYLIPKYSETTRKIGSKEMSFQEWHRTLYGFNYNEKPHKVTISKPFYIGKYEVTQSQYEYIMGKEEFEFITKDTDMIKGPNKPMEWVSYEDIAISKEPIIKKVKIFKLEEGKALNPRDYLDYIKNAPTRDEVVSTGTVCFLERINKLLENQIPSGYKFDLPTEAQWEYACKAGTGKDFVNTDEVAWYRENNGNTKYNDYAKNRDISMLYAAHDVGQKKPNAWGIYDMHGNVAEWCKDYYADYPTGAVTDPVNEFEISFYNNGENTEFNPSFGVIRGGSYADSASRCRTTFRYFYKPKFSDFFRGFRLALVSVDGTPKTSKSSTTSGSSNTAKVRDTDNSSSSKSGSDSSKVKTQTPKQPQTETQTKSEIKTNSKNYDSREYEPVKLKPYKTHPHITVPEEVELEP